jgi:hypothetical protein
VTTVPLSAALTTDLRPPGLMSALGDFELGLGARWPWRPWLPPAEECGRGGLLNSWPHHFEWLLACCLITIITMVVGASENSRLT